MSCLHTAGPATRTFINVRKALVILVNAGTYFYAEIKVLNVKYTYSEWDSHFVFKASLPSHALSYMINKHTTVHTMLIIIIVE